MRGQSRDRPNQERSRGTRAMRPGTLCADFASCNWDSSAAGLCQWESKTVLQPAQGRWTDPEMWSAGGFGERFPWDCRIMMDYVGSLRIPNLYCNLFRPCGSLKVDTPDTQIQTQAGQAWNVCSKRWFQAFLYCFTEAVGVYYI
jgi:hypothetical protein